MIIGVDGNEANIDNRVGVNEYAFNLLWNIYRLSDEWREQYSFVIYLQEKPKNLPPEKKYWKYKIIEGGSFWILRKLVWQLFKDRKNVDIFFTPSHYVPPVCSMPRICAIMDLGYLKFSEQFKKRDFWQLKLWSAWSIRVSKYIISISEFTKQDIVRHYPSASDRIIVTPLGFDNKSFNIRKNVDDVRRIKKKFTMGMDYFLFVGTLKPNKNIEGLIEAWARVYPDFLDYKLVIAGKKGWLYKSIFSKVKNLGLKESIVFTDFVAEKDKRDLIKYAKAFCLPSFWEGFGLDVLSAMASGVPVIVSDRGSLPEVAGECGIFVNPDKVEEISNALKRILTMNSREYDKLVECGLSQAAKFSWEKTARDTLEIFEKMEVAENAL